MGRFVCHVDLINDPQFIEALKSRGLTILSRTRGAFGHRCVVEVVESISAARGDELKTLFSGHRRLEDGSICPVEVEGRDTGFFEKAVTSGNLRAALSINEVTHKRPILRWVIIVLSLAAALTAAFFVPFV